MSSPQQAAAHQPRRPADGLPARTARPRSCPGRGAQTLTFSTGGLTTLTSALRESWNQPKSNSNRCARLPGRENVADEAEQRPTSASGQAVLGTLLAGYLQLRPLSSSRTTRCDGADTRRGSCVLRCRLCRNGSGPRKVSIATKAICLLPSMNGLALSDAVRRPPGAPSPPPRSRRESLLAQAHLANDSAR